MVRKPKMLRNQIKIKAEFHEKTPLCEKTHPQIEMHPSIIP
jgi:hypothetical protein